MRFYLSLIPWCEFFSQGIDLYSNDQDAGRFGELFKLPWLHLSQTGWNYKSGTKTGNLW